MPTDNARIVREALDGAIQGILADQWDAHPSLNLRDKKKLEDALLPNFDDVYVALAALSTELSDLKAELARAREEERGTSSLLRETLPILNAHDCGWDCDIPEGVSCPVPDLRARIKWHVNRAALAPEQKG